MNKVKKILFPALLGAMAIGVTGAVISSATLTANANEGASMVNVSLTDGIVVNYYTDVEGSVTFDNDVDMLDATVEGERVGNSSTYVYKYNLITPQYLDTEFNITLNDDATPVVSDYSVVKYCNDLQEKTADELGVSQGVLEQSKKVAQDLIYYGQTAKAYKLDGAVTASPATVFDGEDKMIFDVGEYTETDKIVNVTVLFDAVPAISFNFKKTTATVTVDGVDVTDKLTEKGGVYTYLQTGIYATDFDKQYEVVFTNGEKVQTLKYSVNDYAARKQNSSDVKMQNLAKALWCYGAGAEALKTMQTYVVQTAPTYTTTGTAVDGAGSEVELPILNATNYTYTEDGNVATFTHKTLDNVVFEKQILAKDALTIGGQSYNDVSANFISTNLSVSYANDRFIFTVAEGSTVDVGATETSSLEVRGTGTLNVTGAVTARNKFVVREDCIVNVATQTGTAVSANIVSVVTDATLNVSVGTGADAVASDNMVYVQGKMSVTNTAKDKTGSGLRMSGELVHIYLYQNCNLVVDGFDHAFRGDSNGHVLNLHLIDGATTLNGTIIHEKNNTSRRYVELYNCNGLGDTFYAPRDLVVDVEVIILSTPDLTTAGSMFDGVDIIELPVLNTTDYNYSENGMTAIYTLKTNETIRFEVTIPDRLRIGNRSFESNQLNEISNVYENVTATYADGVFVLTVNEGATVALENVSTSNLKLAGSGTFNITGVVEVVTAFTVDEGCTVNVKGTGNAITTTNLLINANATLSVEVGSNSNAILASKSVEVYGVLEIENTAQDKTGNAIRTTDAQGAIYVYRTGRISAYYFDWVLRCDGGSDVLYLYLAADTPGLVTDSANGVQYLYENGNADRRYFEAYNCSSVGGNFMSKRELS